MDYLSIASVFVAFGGVVIAGMSLKRDTTKDYKSEGEIWATLQADIQYLKEHLKDLSGNIAKIDLKLDSYSERIARGEEKTETLFRKVKELDDRVKHLEEKCKKQ